MAGARSDSFGVRDWSIATLSTRSAFYLSRGRDTAEPLSHGACAYNTTVVRTTSTRISRTKGNCSVKNPVRSWASRMRRGFRRPLATRRHTGDGSINEVVLSESLDESRGVFEGKEPVREGYVHVDLFGLAVGVYLCSVGVRAKRLPTLRAVERQRLICGRRVRGHDRGTPESLLQLGSD